MIARSWRGAVKTQDAEAYAAYIDETGMRHYADTPGNRGAWMLTREMEGDLTDRGGLVVDGHDDAHQRASRAIGGVRHGAPC
jgi:hypothetical protein